MTNRKEVYVVTDIEADGPIPGPNSMLSFGSVAYYADGTWLGEFSANLHLLPGATPDPKTMQWWMKNPKAWEAHRKDLEEPAAAMQRYYDWVTKLYGSPVFVGYPASYDFMFVYWYLMKFVRHSPFSHSALDMKTLAMTLLGCNYRNATKNSWPKAWFGPDNSHEHVALADAREQGFSFLKMLAEALDRT